MDSPLSTLLGFEYIKAGSALSDSHMTLSVKKTIRTFTCGTLGSQNSKTIGKIMDLQHKSHEIVDLFSDDKMRTIISTVQRHQVLVEASKDEKTLS